MSFAVPSSSFKARPTANNKPLSYSRGTVIRTTNNEIFPSLHPLSALYRERKPSQTQPETLQSGQTEVLEPVKKVKLESGLEMTASLNNNFEHPQVLSSEIKKEAAISSRKSTVDEFRVPKLPKRFYTQNKTQNSDILNKRSFDAIYDEKNSHKGPFQVTSKKAQIPMKLSPERPIEAELLKRRVDTIPNVVNKELEEVKKVEEVSTPAFSHGFNTTILNSLYERLWCEYYSLQIKQGLNQIVNNIQQNHPELLKGFMMNSDKMQLSGDIMIKEEAVNQGSHC